MRFTEAALLHVKDLLSRNLRHAGFVLNGIARATDGDGGIGVSARGGINQKCVALGIVLAILEVFRHVDQSTIGSSAGADRDRFRDDVRRCFIGRVQHFRAGILVLAVVRQRD